MGTNCKTNKKAGHQTHAEAPLVETLARWSTAREGAEITPPSGVPEEDTGGPSMCVSLEACLSGHSCEDKLLGPFHRKMGFSGHFQDALGLLPLAVLWEW